MLNMVDGKMLIAFNLLIHVRVCVRPSELVYRPLKREEATIFKCRTVKYVAETVKIANEISKYA